MTIDIKIPIWDGRKVGIAEHKITSARTRMKISYRKADGSLLYPGYYEMDSNILRRYPTKNARGGVKLYIVPIEDWDHYEEDDILSQPVQYQDEPGYDEHHHPEKEQDEQQGILAL